MHERTELELAEEKGIEEGGICNGGQRPNWNVKAYTMGPVGQTTQVLLEQIWNSRLR